MHASGHGSSSLPDMPNTYADFLPCMERKLIVAVLASFMST